MTKTARIREIFTSIQGEGPYIGVKQLFIRFCECNLACKYCDTEFESKNGRAYSVDELTDIVNSNSDCHSVSLTGGEPLLHTEFLKELLPKCKLPIYLETNATLADKLFEIIDYVDYISADIKLPSSAGVKPLWKEHDEFFRIASDKKLFAKIVFNENITEEEIVKSIELAKKYDVELTLQPEWKTEEVPFDIKFAEKIFDRYISEYKKVRLIPQVHKFLNIR